MSTTAPPTPETSAPADGPVEAPQPSAPARTGLTFEAIAVISLFVAFAAIVVAIFAVGLAARSIDEHRAIADSGGAGGSVSVALSEFAITPGPITATAGGTITVTNDGTTTHDLTVEGQDLATATLDAGGSEDLSLAGLAPGTYTVFCSIPGHRDSGMETSLTVG